eukprot:CAMPEP_0172739468 /NCGR_PEP_ID=MMETSP1074-20121228/122619_1 /TAXON_ID=2916 /ORGANISM="Ceratium fusus, Strain PA161109" /LENGTH=333 /DNA_ID=CAMNT_0013569353 /DNA_START=1 /DNA_END=1002 /DNA_ORIENTATION=+
MTSDGHAQPVRMMPHTAGSEPSQQQLALTVVWCHEGSRGPGCKELRKALSVQAQRQGAMLLCLKKAHHFVQWSSGVTGPYVLLTDWREVKACNEAVTLHGVEGRPICTSVFCINANQQLRAKRWLSSLPERRDPIHIEGELSAAEAPVTHLLQQARAALCKDVQTPAVPLLLTELIKNGPNSLRTSCGLQVAQPKKNQEVPLSRLSIHPMEDNMQTAQKAQHPTLAKKDVATLCLSVPTRSMDGTYRTQTTTDFALMPRPCHQTWLKSNAENMSPMCLNNQTNQTVPKMMLTGAAPMKIDVDPGEAAHVAPIWDSFSCPAKVDKSLLMANYEE